MKSRAAHMQGDMPAQKKSGLDNFCSCNRNILICVRGGSNRIAYRKIVDPSAASVAGAKVSMVSKTTGLKRESTTDRTVGLIPLLPPSTYNLMTGASGFQT